MLINHGDPLLLRNPGGGGGGPTGAVEFTNDVKVKLNSPNGVPHTNGFTIALWFKETVHTDSFCSYWGSFGDGASNVEMIQDDNYDLGFSNNSPPNGGSYDAILNVVPLPDATWYYIAYVHNGTADWVYRNVEGGGASTALNTSFTNSLITTDSEFVMYGALLGSGVFHACHLRMWNTPLTQGELDAECTSLTPVKLTNLWGCWPMTSAATYLNDTSGNGRNLIEWFNPPNTVAGPTI